MNYKAQSGLANRIEIYIEYLLAIWLVNRHHKISNALPNFTQKSVQPMWLYNESEF